MTNPDAFTIHGVMLYKHGEDDYRTYQKHGGDLKCPLCGGLTILNTFRLNESSKRKFSFRCSDCHMKTNDYDSYDELVNLVEKEPYDYVRGYNDALRKASEVSCETVEKLRETLKDKSQISSAIDVYVAVNSIKRKPTV